MPASPKEQVKEQAMGSFLTEEFTIGNAKVVIRELSSPELKALDRSNFQVGPDGELLTKTGQDGGSRNVPVEEKEWRFYERWIAATITPAYTVEELIPWPDSLKKRLCEAARKINGFATSAEVAKNS